MFGRATITLGIGPHSSYVCCCDSRVLCLNSVDATKRFAAYEFYSYQNVSNLYFKTTIRWNQCLCHCCTLLLLHAASAYHSYAPVRVFAALNAFFCLW